MPRPPVSDWMSVNGKIIAWRTTQDDTDDTSVEQGDRAARPPGVWMGSTICPGSEKEPRRARFRNAQFIR